MVDDGVLKTLTYNRFWAKQKNTEPTPGPVNTIIETNGPTQTLEQMIASTDRGILVSRFWYIRGTDPRTMSQTGLTRDGVWMIEKGKIAYPLKNFRFNQSTIKMLAPGNVLAVSKPERVGSSDGGGGSLLPALKLKEFNLYLTVRSCLKKETFTEGKKSPQRAAVAVLTTTAVANRPGRARDGPWRATVCRSRTTCSYRQTHRRAHRPVLQARP